MRQGKKSGKKFPAASFQAAACLIFFCLYLGFWHFSILQFSSNHGLVYCPLQKEWVKSDAPEIDFKDEPLTDICAVNKRKNTFLSEAASNIFARQANLSIKKWDNLFFDYIEKGNQAFAELSHSSDFPAPNLAKSNETEKGLQNTQKDFAFGSSVAMILPYLPRPPSIRKTVSFETFLAHPLDKISRRIAPRAPPFFA